MESSDVMGENAKKIWAVKHEIGAQERTTPPYLLLNILFGGKFHFSNHKTEYLGGCIYMKEVFGLDELKMSTLRGIVMDAQKSVGYRVNDRFSMWYRIAGRNLTSGRKKIENKLHIKQQSFHFTYSACVSTSGNKTKVASEANKEKIEKF